MPDPKNGAPAEPQMSEADMAQFQAMAEEQTVAAMLPLLLGLGPHLHPTALEAIVRGVVKQQSHPAFQQVMDDAIDPKAREAHGDWGVRLYKRPRKAKQSPELVLRCPKDPGKLRGADEVLQYVTVLGIITNPTARAMLLAHGYEPEFFQMRSALIATL